MPTYMYSESASSSREAHSSGLKGIKPFLRWAGSKRNLLPKLLPYFPTRFNTYHEPFLGSGSVFFHLNPSKAVLSDANQELVSTYLVLRDHPGRISNLLEQLSPDRETYYSIRKDRSKLKLLGTAQFIYLNKLCFNGIYRVNSKGEFNVPFAGDRLSYSIDREHLLACAQALNKKDVKIFSGDFSENLAQAQAGDFVFIDPPYVTGHNNNGFIEYNESIFSWDDQIRLAKDVMELKKRKVAVVVSNAYHESVLDLYPAFEKYKIERFSSIASDTSKRKTIAEAVITFLP
jgi:DNA adenine methylase